MKIKKWIKISITLIILSVSKQIKSQFFCEDFSVWPSNTTYDSTSVIPAILNGQATVSLPDGGFARNTGTYSNGIHFHKTLQLDFGSSLYRELRVQFSTAIGGLNTFEDIHLDGNELFPGAFDYARFISASSPQASSGLLFPLTIGGTVIEIDSVNSTLVFKGTFQSIAIGGTTSSEIEEICIDSTAFSPCEDFSIWPSNTIYDSTSVIPSILNGQATVSLPDGGFARNVGTSSTGIQFFKTLKLDFGSSLFREVRVQFSTAIGGLNTFEDIHVNGSELFPGAFDYARFITASSPHASGGLLFPLTIGGTVIEIDSVNSTLVFKGTFQSIAIGGTTSSEIEEICVDTNVNTCNINPTFRWNTGGNNNAQFHALDINNNYDYHWDYGDGNTDSRHTNQHFYGTSGTYYVCLTITNRLDSNCVDSYCDSVTVVNQSPIFTPNNDGIDDTYLAPCASKIYNRNGVLVRTLAGPSLVWDGKDDNGNLLPRGQYTIICDADNSITRVTLFR